jgi:HK97 gp10 family phage protein
MVDRLEVKGGKALERALLRLPKELDRARVTTNALAAGGRVIRDEAKLAVPVETGELRDSIVVRRVRGQAGHVVVGFLKPTSRRAHLTEFGTSTASARPFMRPALDVSGRAAINEIARALRKGIDRVAAKLGRRR